MTCQWDVVVKVWKWSAGLAAVCACLTLAAEVRAQAPRAMPELDRRVQGFLAAERDQWDYLNVPYQDGKILHDLVVKGAHKVILEIGTSTGHSTVWLAWAAAKTGGRVITIEIDRTRHERALAHLKRAGLAGVRRCAARRRARPGQGSVRSLGLCVPGRRQRMVPAVFQRPRNQNGARRMLHGAQRGAAASAAGHRISGVRQEATGLQLPFRRGRFGGRHFHQLQDALAGLALAHLRFSFIDSYSTRRMYRPAPARVKSALPMRQARIQEQSCSKTR